jgi:SAM-dependent methyltransferase
LFQKLRLKWVEVPVGNDRIRTDQISGLSDQDLLALWTRGKIQATSGENFSVRGWYHTLYIPILRGLRVLDVGSGLGIDGITFAQNGAHVTFLDIVQSNLDTIHRLSGLFNLASVKFVHLDELSALSRLEEDYDVIWCQGSMICMPAEIAGAEARELLKHLKANGRWIELAYPRTRWEREGKLPFDKWGSKTDGGAPWTEWYDLDKLLRRLYPAKFDVVLNMEFHNHDFVWFDLIRRSETLNRY